MNHQLLAFATACLVVVVVPGPDLMLVLRNNVRAGGAGALWTVAGIMTALAVLATAAAVGITGLLATFPAVFDVVRVAGGLYLVFLGVQAWRSYRHLRRQPADGQAVHPAKEASGSQPTRWTSFRQGLLCNLLNPKVAAFYLSLFPQFDFSPLPPVVQHIVMAAGFWLICLLWYTIVLTLLGRAAGLLRSPAFARRTEAVAGTALLGLGGYVLLRT
ncbi:LysE family translocator [Litorihabitans aurantiacus]|uniref:Amino acid transporter n=1 Tax=Litorihabitans aurantiacus TaxID=1930061 RepID=A0AA37UU07_9MICO|nr:LysE family translocator [Litorihabitans aurantiacus]GMA30417.1 amino acid transporter [Litorihabitans aurantiacus]